MSTPETPATPATPPTLEEKIEQASVEAAQIAELFSPAVGQAIGAGVSVEPLIFGLISTIGALFKHHTKAAAPKA